VDTITDRLAVATQQNILPSQHCIFRFLSPQVTFSMK